MTWHTFWNMGGFAIYVWPSFIFGFLVMAGNVIAAARLEMRVKREVREAIESFPGSDAQ